MGVSPNSAMACFVSHFVAFSSGSALLLLDTRSGHTSRHQVHSQEITALKGGSQTCVTGGKDGKLVVWTFPSFTVAELGAPIRMIATTSSKCYFVRGSVVHVNVLSLASTTLEPEVLLKGKIEGAIDMEVLPRESGLAILQRNGCLMYRFDAKDAILASHEVPLTAIAVSPTENCITLGDSFGQIIRLYTDSGVKTKTHWHSHAVKSLAYTSDGTMLLSGGEEGVIVLWQEATNKKTFLPRLEAPILNVIISADCSMYGVRLLDNSVKVFQASDYAKIAHFHGLTDPSKLLPGTQIHLTPYQSDSICLNSTPGFLQFYSLKDRQITLRLNCSKRNQVSRSQNEYPNPAQVVSVAFGKDWRSMATVERADCAHFRIAYLKFWGEERKLNTLVLNPHENDPLKVLSLSKSFISVGRQGTIIEWREGLDEKVGSTWQGSRPVTYRGLSAIDACEYQNSLCVAFTSLIVHFSPDFTPQSVIYEKNSENYVQIAASGALLVTATRKTLAVYANSTVLWSLDLYLVHSVATSADFFCVSLNPSSYTPMEIREKHANVVIKFSTSCSKPEGIFKVDEPKSVFLHNGEVWILDKNCEFHSLESSFSHSAGSSDLPTIRKMSENGGIPRARERGGVEVVRKVVLGVESVKSSELPGLMDLFETVISPLVS